MCKFMIWCISSHPYYALYAIDLALHCPITKTCLYNFDPLKPHFYIVKLGFTGVCIIFLISAQKHRLWVLGEAVLTSTHNLCFEQKFEKYQIFLSENFKFLEVKFSVYLNRHVFVMLPYVIITVNNLQAPLKYTVLVLAAISQ